MIRIFLISFCALIASCHGAVTITWQSDIGATNLESDGLTPLDGGFEFMLGTFVGITPTTENLEEWENAWRPFSVAAYSVDNKRFFNSEILRSNDAPFTTNAQAYIWGRNGTLPGSEWILVGRPIWKWPTASTGGPPGFPENWLVADTSESDVVIGAVNGDGFQMQTALAHFDLSYERWVELNFQDGEASAQDDDFDNDGRSNFLEYALNSAPKVKDGPFQVIMNSDLEIVISRASGRDVNWVLKSSNDLATGFTTMTSGFEIVVDEPSRLVFKITEPRLAKQFFQVEAVAP